MTQEKATKHPSTENARLRIDSTTRIDELNLDLTQATCSKTGAKIVHLKNDDPEKLFCISLPTYPSNSRGTPHILEHTVLCGCKKYPVKDPFFYMIRRSMNTFMNAFTGSDFTCYPASSLVKQDFENLFDVYFSSVFEPLLEKESFLQEGFRLEYSDGKLSRAGIVYNEMKGAYQNPQGLLWRKLQQSLFSQGTYGYDSGGDPQEIPEITHEELKKFHADHYHPSRAIFYFYGDIDFDVIEEMLLPKLQDFEQQQPGTFFQQGFLASDSDKAASSVYVEDYPADPSARTMICSAAWEVAQIDQVEKAFQYALVDQLLMGHDGSPLKKLLLESDLVDSCDSHLDTEMRQIPYALCFYSGVEDQKYQERQKKLASLLSSGLEKTLVTGFTEEEIEAALHQLKLQLLDISSSSYPLGLSLFFRVGLAMQHGVNPLQTLRVHHNIAQLEIWAQNPQNIKECIQSSLIDKKPIWQVMKPSASMNADAIEREKAQLEAEAIAISGDQLTSIEKEKNQLKKWQSRDEKKIIATLPLLSLDAIDEGTKELALEIDPSDSPAQKASCYTHRCFTNSFSFHKLQTSSKINLDQESIASAAKALLRSRALSFWAELGAADLSYSEASALIEGCCHEIYAKEKTAVHIDGCLLKTLQFRVSALQSKLPSALQRLQEHLLHKRFDETDRLQQLIDQHIQEVFTSIADLGYGFAKSASSRSLSKAGAYLDHTGGLCSIVLACMLQNKERVHQLITALPAIYGEIFKDIQGADWVSTIDQKAPSTSLPCDLNELKQQAQKASCEKSEEAYKTLLEDLSKAITDYTQWSDHFGFAIPSEVAFNAMSIKAPYSYTDPKCAHAMLAAALMNHLYLHTHIREKGGAYGAGSHFDTARGVLSFYSYRDPNIIETFAHFEQALNFLKTAQVTETQLHEAKLKVLQSIEAPISPSSRGAVAHQRMLTGLTKQHRDQHKKAILRASIDDVYEVVDQFIQTRQSQDKQLCCYVSFAGLPLLEQAQKRWPAKQRGEFSLYNMQHLSKSGV